MVRIRREFVSAGRTFRLRDEEDEDVQVVEPPAKSPKKGSGTRGGKKRKQTTRTREQSGEPSVEHQTEEHLVSGSEEELEQPTNANASVMKSPRKGKKTTKWKRKSPRTRSGVQDTMPTAQRSGEKKHPANKQPKTQTAEQPTPLPKFIDDDARDRKSATKFCSSNSEVISLFEDLRQHIILLEDGLMMTMSSEQQATFIEKRNLLVPPTPQDNENAHQKEPRSEPTTETTPEYRASSSQPQDKGKAPAIEEETDDDDDEDTEEEEDPAQFRLARRRPGSSKITI
ncbi:uncharacterized protein LOC113780488 [Coffea eugenioides]|uniref:uncharacterized protein LOC113780488 n=1 Tax=Coffea eugenioides TaxID=49369 RepID=UPI000F61441A|nr:uncharacterized protein LOC113780488 [Coffea eugenioides]